MKASLGDAYFCIGRNAKVLGLPSFILQQLAARPSYI